MRYHKPNRTNFLKSNYSKREIKRVSAEEQILSGQRRLLSSSLQLEESVRTLGAALLRDTQVHEQLC